MKKFLLATLLLTFTALSVTSCQKRCRGGGWYGDRNLGYVPKQQEKKQSERATITEENACLTSP